MQSQNFKSWLGGSEMLIDMLAHTTKLDKERIVRIAATASVRYKVYDIPKRKGGTRRIEHPSQELKAIQRWIVKAVFDRFPVHEAATAYRKGASIRENAEKHRRTLFTNRYDFASFFPSFREAQIRRFLDDKCPNFRIELNQDDIDFICSIVCRNGRLTIGAPSSPAITNTMMFDFDSTVQAYCVENGLVYTRYADDVFVSAYEPNRLGRVEEEIRRAKRFVPHLSLRLNRRKTAFLSKRYRRRITGVVITPEHELSIGRKRKREIKALIHKWINNNLDKDYYYYMMGLIAFARDVEPTFETILRRKYGDAVIEEILSGSAELDDDDPRKGVRS